jgi:hypothetical protein
MANLRNSSVNGLNLCSNAPYNTAFGYGALANNAASSGSNTGIGSTTLFNNTDGINNTAIGFSALSNCYVGTNKTAIGTGAGTNDNFINNTSIGAQAGRCPQGKLAVSIGYYAGKYHRCGDVNIGYRAGYGCTAYGNNVAIGYYALINGGSGVYSVVFGSIAGKSIGDRSVIGGFGSGVNTGGASNNILIGYGASQQNGYGCNDQSVLGNANNNVYNCVYAAWTDVSDCRDKTNFQPINNLGLNFLRKLNPVKYKWDLRQKYENKCGYEYGIKDGTLKQDQTEYGFLAQEIEFAAKSLGENFDAVTHDTFIDQYSLNYLNLIATLTKALQEINDDLDLIETQLNS